MMDYRAWVTKREPGRCTIDQGPFGSLEIDIKEDLSVDTRRIPFLLYLERALEQQEEALKHQIHLLTFQMPAHIDYLFVTWRTYVTEENEPRAVQIQEDLLGGHEDGPGCGYMKHVPEWNSKMLSILKPTLSLIRNKCSVIKNLFQSPDLPEDLDLRKRITQLGQAVRNQQTFVRMQLQLMGFQHRLFGCDYDDQLRSIDELIEEFERLEQYMRLDQYFEDDDLKELSKGSAEVGGQT